MRYSIALSLLATATSIGAQTIDTSTVPRDLATALVIGTGFGPRGTIDVGKVADGFDRSWMPADLLLLGSFRTSTVFAAQAAPDAALESAKAALGKAGWGDPPEPPVGQGFRGTALMPMGPVGGRSMAVLCRDKASLMISAMRRDGGGSYVVVAGQEGMNYFCDPAMIEQMRGGGMRMRMDIPALIPPKGVRGNSTGSSGSDRSMDLSAEYDTPMSAKALVEHFAAQMEKEGWKRTSFRGDDEFALAKWEKPAKVGSPDKAFLMDVRMDTRHSVRLNVSKDGGERFP